MRTITVDHRKVGKLLFWAIGLFVLVNFILIAFAAIGYEGRTAHFLLWRLLYVDREQNIPTYFSSLLLLAAALLAIAASTTEQQKKGIKAMWVLLGLGLLAVSLDEFISMHEMYGSKIGLAMMGDKTSADDFQWNATSQIGNLEVLHVFAWVIPALAVLVLAAPFAWAFVRALPAQIRPLVLASGVVFVTGALGFEVLTALLETKVGYESPWYSVGVVIEESLEMVGATMFIVAMVRHFAARVGSLRIDLN